MTFPITRFQSVSFELIHDTRIASARLNRYRKQGSKEPYFEFELDTDLYDYEYGLAIGAELDAYQGELELFDLPNPIVPINSLTNAVLAYDASVGDTQITLSTPHNSKTGVVSAGDFLQIEGSTKAYSIRIDEYNSNASGQVVVRLSQPLIKNYDAGAEINYGEDVVFQCCLTSRDSTEISGSQGRKISYSLEVIEQI